MTLLEKHELLKTLTNLLDIVNTREEWGEPFGITEGYTANAVRNNALSLINGLLSDEIKAISDEREKKEEAKRAKVDGKQSIVLL